MGIEHIESWLELPTSVLLSEAWRVRRQHFDSKVVFAVPGAKGYENEFYQNNREKFVNISLTGNDCVLNCEHCKKKLLGTMIHCLHPAELLTTIKDLIQSGCEGVLLSGGADQEGAVPLEPFLDAIEEIKRLGLRVIVHTGLAKEKTVADLKRVGVDQVLVDIIGDRETIRQVYHLDKEPEDYLEFLNLCKRYELDVAPHIVIGLQFGRITGEIEAIKMISQIQAKHIVLVILTPLSGTPMAEVIPPSVEECGRLIALARLCNPTSQLSLGCARPAGAKKPLLEQYALNAGVNVIAYPSAETINLAKEMGLMFHFTDHCCTLL